MTKLLPAFGASNEKVYPTSCVLNNAEPAYSHFDAPLPETGTHLPFESLNCALKRMYMRCRRPSPGIRARTPIESGELAVSPTFTVAQRFLLLAEPAGAAARKQARAAADTRSTRLMGG